MSQQAASRVLMVSPDQFRSNHETASDNHFQNTETKSSGDITTKALKEFHSLVTLLQSRGVEVKVFSGTGGEDTPDAVFPNNWFSTHQLDDPTCVLYPLYAPCRRRERRADIIDFLFDQYIADCDFTDLEQGEIYLEGTGSLVLDHDHKRAYACRSLRTSVEAVYSWCAALGFIPIIFDALDEQGRPVYHTNVIMSISPQTAVVCLDMIKSESHKEQVLESLETSGKVIIPITEAQVNSFCGNILSLIGKDDSQLFVMSSSAYSAFTDREKIILSQFGELCHVDLSTIETFGGGSARCMIAELF